MDAYVSFVKSSRSVSHTSLFSQWSQSGLKPGGSWIRVKKINFFRQILENLDFFRQFHKNLDFPGKNWSFTATSGQIILFLFKSHHFRTYFLYMISYNNISRPVHDPVPKIWGSKPPTPRI